MCIRVSRLDGTFICDHFEFHPYYWRFDLKNIRDKYDSSGQKYFLIKRVENLAVYLNIKIDNNIIEFTLYVDDAGISWLDFNDVSEVKKYNLLRNIVALSNISNGEKLDWGMVNYFYDSKTGCSYLIIYYILNENSVIPDPIFNEYQLD